MARISLVTALLLATMLPAGGQAPAGGEDYLERIFLAEPDGFGMKPLVDLPEFKRQGSPTWSHDGKLIAFDAWRPQLGERLADAKVIIVNADGSNPRVLGDGAMPSFSPRSQRIACSRYGANQGVWLMSTAQPDKDCVLLDRDGWGADWSPDGRRIVYALDDETSANLVVYDLVEGTRQALFDAQTARYRSVFWNFTWSPDSRRIVFKGQRKDDTVEMGIVDARGAQHGLSARFEGNVMSNFAWRPDGKRVLFTYPRAGRGTPMQQYAIDPDSNDPPQLLPGQDPARSNTAAAYSPDGKRLALVCSPRLPLKKQELNP
jgi:TolB protein